MSTEALEWDDEAKQQYGLAFELAMLKTDPDENMQLRKGDACLHVVSDVLEVLLADLIKEDGTDAQPES